MLRRTSWPAERLPVLEEGCQPLTMTQPDASRETSKKVGHSNADHHTTQEASTRVGQWYDTQKADYSGTKNASIREDNPGRRPFLTLKHTPLLELNSAHLHDDLLHVANKTSTLSNPMPSQLSSIS